MSGEALRAVAALDPLFIGLADGTRLAATLWLPQDAAARPVPAVLEAVPYRRREGTAFRDAEMAPWFAARGIAYCRLDLRGSGDSEGLLEDEYLPREQEDLCEVVAWLAAQAWCSGAVGMTGISWGGFNALQVAARRPPALKAVIALCCSDDRHADDVHYMGGSLLTEDPLWSCFMLANNALPPDPQVVGPAWRRLWQERLAGARCWSETWLAHQRRDGYWRQGSVCEAFGAIELPCYLVGGWDDSYSNAVPRLLAGLSGPRKGLIGPWSHSYPFRGTPGPTIGYLQEALAWWRHWLCGEANAVMEGPQLRAWIAEPQPPAACYSEHPGRWVGEDAWPPARPPLALWLNDRRLEPAAAPGAPLSVRSPVTAGRDCGRWGGYGGDSPDMALDQRREDGLALAFDSAPLETDLELLGAAVLELELAVDAPRATLTARLCDVAPDGSSSLVTWGTLNLAHRDDPSAPSDLEPGRTTAVRLALNDCGRRIPAGHRLRLALATQHWPILLPQPWMATLSLPAGRSRLLLPVRPPQASDAALAAFAAAESAPPLPAQALRAARNERLVEQDVGAGSQRITLTSDYGRYRLVDRAIVTESCCRERFSIVEDDPLSARIEGRWFIAFESGEAAVSVTAEVALQVEAEALLLTWSLTAREGEATVARREGRRRLPRDRL